ncbi:hypothetical protein GOV06_04450 [Candidatus Woesearchaeota archaeon]|nr:hypothetical protein [Candidatus Woesearchaeota archaeon]
MVEFNPDGSIKLPELFAKRKEENERRLKNQRCIRVKREIVNFDSPKKCVLNITLSEAISDNRFIENIYNFFKEKCSVPVKIKKISEKEFEIEVGTDFRRCSDCNSLINKYKDFLDGNLIDEKGNCTYEIKTGNFCYEDYFD